MGGQHGGLLLHRGDSVVHRAPAHLKVIALLAYAIGVVATPAGWWWLFVAELALVLGVIAASRVPPSHLARRMVVELPVVVFAVLLPFVAHGPRTDVLGVTVSASGLDAGLALLVKATLGVLASLTLAATTEPQDLLRGLTRLRVPALLVQIMGFMLRYLELVADDLRRMRIARESRGFATRGPRAWPVLARTLGALFIRSFERGERVHLAMLSRGYTGKLPPS